MREENDAITWSWWAVNFSPLNLKSAPNDKKACWPSFVSLSLPSSLPPNALIFHPDPDYGYPHSICIRTKETSSKLIRVMQSSTPNDWWWWWWLTDTRSSCNSFSLLKTPQRWLSDTKDSDCFPDVVITSSWSRSDGDLRDLTSRREWFIVWI